jgi:hypothetical protein
MPSFVATHAAWALKWVLFAAMLRVVVVGVPPLNRGVGLVRIITTLGAKW